MLVKVVAYHPVSSENPQDTDGGTTSHPPLHVCLATSDHHALSDVGSGSPGILLTVGRKNCDVTISSDRAVSRAHCALRLVSKDAPEDGEGGRRNGVDADGGETRKNEARRPRTEEERNACEEALDDCALVLEDLGSKFGTYVVVEAKPEGERQSAGRRRGVGDGSETDDATDDDAPGAGANADDGTIAMTPTMRHVADLASPPRPEGGALERRLIRLQPKSSHVLRELSLTESSSSSSSSSTCGAVLVQLGQNGTTLSLMRIPLRFCLSRVDASVKSHLEESAHRVGATVVTSWDPRTATHLIAPVIVSTAKSISAWASRRPIVRADYVDALLHRADASDPLPDESSYAPPGDEFSNVDPNKPRDCLRGYVCISLADGETEWMAASAGAEVMRAYELDNKSYFAGMWLDDLLAWEKRPASGEKRLKVVLIDTHSKRAKKRIDWIKRKKVPTSSTREIAAAISELRTVLVGVDGEEIPLAGPLPPSREEGERSTSEAVRGGDSGTDDEADGEAKKMSPIPEGTNEDGTERSKSQSQGREEKSSASGGDESSSIPLNSQKRKRKDEENEEDENDSRKEGEETSKRVKRRGKDGEDDANPPPIECNRRRNAGLVDDVGKDQGEADFSSADVSGRVIRANLEKRKKCQTANQADEEREDNDLSGRTRPKIMPVASFETKNRRRTATQTNDSTNDDAADDINDDPTTALTRTETSPPTASDGWMKAAVVAARTKSSRERAEDRALKTELSEMGSIAPAAVTERRSDLIVRTDKDLRRILSDLRREGARRGRKRVDANGRPVKDYKRFHKNAVIAGNHINGASVHLRSVLPKETERQIQIELSQRELERTQREADELFMDDVQIRGSLSQRSLKSGMRKAGGKRRVAS